MITIKKRSGKQCVFCPSTDTVDAKVRGVREFHGSICKEHLWKFLPTEANAAKPATEEKTSVAR